MDWINFTGTNSAEVRAFTKHHGAPDGETWFITKGMTSSTGNQSWRYVKEGRDWGEKVIGAVYCPTLDSWLPVERGDLIVWNSSTKTMRVETAPENMK